MKRLATGLVVVLLAMNAYAATSRDALWKQVEDAIKKGLPQTAITNLNLIVPAAVREKAYGEAAKAIARKIVLEGTIQGNKPEEKITRMEAEIAQAPAEMKSLLEVILANWYWHYFQQNRWRFMQRTQTGAAPGPDFTTWDLARLFAEIDKVFTRARSSADALKKLPVSTFDDLLTKGTLPDAYRPTLFDFVAQEALKFYTSGEQAGAKPEDAFELGADSPALDNAEKFLAWHRAFRTKEFPDSPIVKALDLYGQLLDFHQRDSDPRAFADADLARLHYAYNTAVGDEKSARFKAALAALADRWADHEGSALALSHWAEVVRGEGDLVEARRLAQRGVNTHRDSPGGRQCQNLISEIEARSSSIGTERVWNQPLPKITLRYRNVTNAWFRVVAWDWNDFLERRHRRPENLSDQERKALLAKTPSLEWSAPLPPTPDFKERVEELPAPTELKKGHYFLVASHNAAFSEEDNQVTYTAFWVSDLALVVRPREGQLEGFVLNALSGEPLVAAEVQGWYLDNNGSRIAVPKVATDELGFFSLKAQGDNRWRGYLLRARHGGDELGSLQEHHAGEPGRSQPQEQTIFFTDRALYRPGQTVSYKGILLRVDAERNDYQLLKGRRLTALFLDPNGKEIAKTEHVCNDYGSFSGSFAAPRDRVMGRYQIGAVNGRASFNVEEYKRPKFRVTLDAPKTAPRLNDAVDLQGKAESYTGAAVDGAQVKWRVVREVRLPWWCWWGWRGWRGNASQEIAHGTARTETDGTFKIAFTARPDLSVSPTNEPTFYYTVNADVTDPAGETRSAQRGVHVGYTTLQVNVTADDWQTDAEPVELSLKSTTLDDEPQRAEGSLKVHRLKEPARVPRAALGGEVFDLDADGVVDRGNPADPNTWPLGEVTEERGWTTDTEGKAKLDFKLKVGFYRAMLETQDRFGKKVTARLGLRVLAPDAPKLALNVPNLVTAPKWRAEPGDEFLALWGTGYGEGRAFIEIEHRHKMVQRFWTSPGRTQQQVRQAVTEAMHGGFQVHVTQVRENRAYMSSHRVDVPWSNKALELKWEHFTSKLEPGQKETWTLQVRGAKSEVRGAEMVAALYDESLDQYLPHDWLRRFDFFYQDFSYGGGSFENSIRQLQHLRGAWRFDRVDASYRYREFPQDLVANIWGYGFGGGPRRLGMAKHSGGPVPAMVEMDAMSFNAPAPMALAAEESAAPRAKMAGREVAFAASPAEAEAKAQGAGFAPKPPDLSQVAARKNLNETAFFFPQLLADSNGTVRIQFTMPEALTSWRFLGFAHDQELRSGFLGDKAVTAKDLMVQPNPPRFLREGDELEFTVKVSNQSAARQEGRVKLSFNYAFDEKSADQDLGNQKAELSFDIPSKESRTFSWRLKAPDGCGFLTYKAVGSTGRISDGEEGYLPVLSRRILVTESLPLPIRGKVGGGEVVKKFEFEKLLQSGKSDTLVHQNLVVQMVSQPAWYAVMALPYLMEFPHECNEQLFNRLYANALARHIANSDPKIRRVFEQWKGTPALDSPLEKNQDLKSVMIEETPWLRQAQNESQARRNVALLFDENRLSSETDRALQKLAEAQLGDGSWSWFPGGRGNDYITLYITTGFGRLRHLGVDLSVAPAIRSLERLDRWMDEHYREILRRPHPEEYVPSGTDALYLYGRSFFLKDRPVAKNHEEAISFFLKQSRAFWLQTNWRQTQGHLAIALNRWGGDDNKAAARDILRSIRERSVNNEEMGMFWRETELSWWWYRAPIETQALMIEAFDEVVGDKQAVEDCRVWLLKQKQTRDWKTTKATADAIYGLLLRGRDFLASDKLVEVTLGGINVTPQVGRAVPSAPERRREDTAPYQVEAGTGFYERRFGPGQIKPKLGDITVKKVDEGVSWGSVHWQYLEDMTKVTPYEGTPLKLKKSLYTKVNTTRGPELKPVNGALAVGDELVVRIELRVDRDMEYVHLKDQRGSGTEPVNVLSQYKYQDGLAYYESTRDTASHFFIDYLPKGTYVFEYSTRVQHRGAYQTGLASIQCMYAPEFNSHSESLRLTVAAGTR
jgi:uncharacterized protein YfaS (alpha-2-macroglobulin family)